MIHSNLRYQVPSVCQEVDDFFEFSLFCLFVSPTIFCNFGCHVPFFMINNIFASWTFFICNMMTLQWVRIHSRKEEICSKSATGFLTCSYQADIRMRSHRLLRLVQVDNRHDASCLAFYLTRMINVVSTTSTTDLHRFDST